MIVAGGVYLETCVTPETEQLLGSAGRAALGLSALRQDLVLHTFHPAELWEDLEANFRPYGIDCRLNPAPERITFGYLFPLARPMQRPGSVAERSRVRVSGPKVLSFGCIEGDFVVDAQAAVFDPQGMAAGFHAMGTAAERLALVLNANEALAQARVDDLNTAALKLLSGTTAQTIVVKDGPYGAHVLDAQGSFQHVPAYASESNYTIGSGDVFSAIFAHFWLDGMDAADAADQASRYTAAYVESPLLPFPVITSARAPRQSAPVGRLVVLCNLSTVASRWFANVLYDAVERLGHTKVDLVDLNDVLAGTTKLNDDASLLVCPPDSTTLALVEAHPILSGERGTIFVDEAFAPAPHAPPAQGSRVVTDLAQAVYNACWSLR